jgi:hypothetical protein
MRLIGRLFVAVLGIVVLALAVYGGVRGVEWVWSRDSLGLFAREPAEPLRIETLDPYTRKVAGKRWFGDYFATMVFSQTTTTDSPRIVAKWQRPTVTIKLLTEDAPEAERYLRRLVDRLDRLQDQVDFELGGARPLITIEFLDHATYARRNGTGSVGTTRTRYFQGPPGLIRARIAVDTGTQDTPDELKSTLIHELTHAIGLSGHFASAADRRKSVMYEANTLTSWSQSDAAVIRVLYSPFVRSGMSPAAARAGVKRYARAARASSWTDQRRLSSRSGNVRYRE